MVYNDWRLYDFGQMLSYKRLHSSTYFLCFERLGNVVSQGQNQGQRHQPVVLVVDDNAAIRDMVTWALELDGFASAVAAEGQEALAWMDNAARDGLYPAVILLDLAMPGMDGDAFLERLQASWEKARPMPAIVLITASQNAPE